MQPETAKSILYFDGSCQLCRAEIRHYRGVDLTGALGFVDVSSPDPPLPDSLTRQQVMKRFHVSDRNGKILSGAEAFVEVWSRLPAWRWAARAAMLPGVMRALEAGYTLFLPIRPFISGLFSTIQRLRLRTVRDKCQ